MAAYTQLISYDLGAPETSENYQNLIRRIKSLDSGCIRPLKSQWLIRTDLDVDDVVSILSPYLDSNDKLLVVSVKGDSWWSHGFDATTLAWLKANISS